MKKLLLKIGVACFVLGYLFVSPANATVLWNGDAANGTSVWKSLEIKRGDQTGTGSITVVTDPTYGKVWRMYKPAPDNRCEARGAKNYQAAEGDEIYIGWRFKLSSTVDNNAVFQWKAYGSNMLQNFPVVLKMVGGQLKLMHNNENYVSTFIWSKSVSTNQWMSVVLRMKISKTSSAGFIEFWFDGVKQTLSNGTQRYTCRTLDASYCDPKFGVYGASGNEVINTVHTPKIATTYNEAAPGGGGGITPPNAPSNLTASAVSSSQINLAWSDNSSNEDNFRIERSTDGSTWSSLTTLSANVISYSNTGLAPNARYYYRVRASNAGGNSAYSNTANATTQSGNSTTVYQAENGTLYQAVVESTNAGYLGTGYVNHNAVTGSYVQWAVTASVAGSTTFVVRYSNGGTSNRPMNVIVNGSTTVSNLAFNSTGAWTSYSTVSFTASLNAGSNTVRLSTADASGGPNTDQIEVTDLKNAKMVPDVPAEIAADIYPNPATDEVKIRYAIKEAAYTSICICNVDGKIIENLVNEYKEPGEFKVVWNASDKPAGVYFVRIKTGANLKNIKLIVKK